jgi:hypothetical protein
MGCKVCRRKLNTPYCNDLQYVRGGRSASALRAVLLLEIAVDIQKHPYPKQWLYEQLIQSKAGLAGLPFISDRIANDVFHI